MHAVLKQKRMFTDTHQTAMVHL